MLNVRYLQEAFLLSGQENFLLVKIVLLFMQGHYPLLPRHFINCAYLVWLSRRE